MAAEVRQITMQEAVAAHIAARNRYISVARTVIGAYYALPPAERADYELDERYVHAESHRDLAEIRVEMLIADEQEALSIPTQFKPIADNPITVN